MVEAVIKAVVAALVYSIVFYIKKRESAKPEDFNRFKFISTLIVGVIIGLALWSSGVPLSQMTLAEELAAMTGTIALVESVLKTLYRSYKNRLQG